MSHSTPSPKHDRFDPLVVHARREALVILAAFATVSINHPRDTLPRGARSCRG
jgi:hypothetical protein